MDEMDEMDVNTIVGELQEYVSLLECTDRTQVSPGPGGNTRSSCQGPGGNQAIVSALPGETENEVGALISGLADGTSALKLVDDASALKLFGGASAVNEVDGTASAMDLVDGESVVNLVDCAFMVKLVDCASAMNVVDGASAVNLVDGASAVTSAVNLVDGASVVNLVDGASVVNLVDGASAVTSAVNLVDGASAVNLVDGVSAGKQVDGTSAVNLVDGASAVNNGQSPGLMGSWRKDNMAMAEQSYTRNAFVQNHQATNSCEQSACMQSPGSADSPMSVGLPNHQNCGPSNASMATYMQNIQNPGPYSSVPVSPNDQKASPNASPLPYPVPSFAGVCGIYLRTCNAHFPDPRFFHQMPRNPAPQAARGTKHAEAVLDPRFVWQIPQHPALQATQRVVVGRHRQNPVPANVLQPSTRAGVNNSEYRKLSVPLLVSTASSEASACNDGQIRRDQSI